MTILRVFKENYEKFDEVLSGLEVETLDTGGGQVRVLA